MIKWHLESRPIKSLKAYSKNPRKLTSEQYTHLHKSLEKFGLIDKPIVNHDNTIIGGHQRISVLKKDGIKDIECWIPERQLEEREIEELNIRLNKNTGEWDWDILANEWEVNDLIDWGFSPEEIFDANVEDLGSTEEDNEVLEPGQDADAITKLGDVYDLNQHRLICGDSTLPDVVTNLLGLAIPILMVTDPPYGVEYDPNWRDPSNIGTDGIRVSVKSKGKVQNDDKVNWALAYSLFPGSIAYVWHSLKMPMSSLSDAGYEIISEIIWVKQHFALSRGDYHWQHEPCWYAVKKGHNHNWQGSRKECTIWEIASMSAFGGKKEDGEERTAHSTQKPMECMAKPIRNNTAVGEGVYDPFLGSGTTLIACEQLGRICYGIELSSAYCDIIIARWIKWMQKNQKPFTIKKNGLEINCEEYVKT